MELMAPPSVTINSSSTVFPARPTPAGTLSLSECDQWRAWTHIPLLYVFKSPAAAAATAAESLKSSLSQILVPYYPFAGRLHWIAGGRLELDCCAAGVQLIEASSDATLDDYGDFAPSDAVQNLAPEIDYSLPMEELPVLLVQVTRFRCGGLVVVPAISHTLVDGASTITFINSWATIARGEKTAETILQPLHDRKVIQPEKPFRPPRFNHVVLTEPPPLLIGCCDDEEERKKESTTALLKLTKEQVEKLKKRANSLKGPNPNTNTIDQNRRALDELQSRPYSRYESIAGHIWVCACKARSTGKSSQMTVARIIVDVRRRLRIPISENFTGNSSMVILSPQCEFGDLMTQPLSFAARKIREGAWKMTGEYAESVMDFLAGQEDVSWLRTSFHNTAIQAKASFWGNPNLAIGSWMSLPFYDADFGWGRPCYVGPTTLNIDGKSYIMPGPASDGSLIVALRLQTKHMEHFKKFFYEDLSERLGARL